MDKTIVINNSSLSQQRLAKEKLAGEFDKKNGEKIGENHNKNQIKKLQQNHNPSKPHYKNPLAKKYQKTPSLKPEPNADLRGLTSPHFNITRTE